MTINGHEYGLAYNVQALGDMLKLVNGDLKKLKEMMSGLDRMETIAELAAIFSKGYEDQKAYEARKNGEKYEPHYLHKEDVIFMDADEMPDVVNAVNRCMNKGRKTEVKAKPAKNAQKADTVSA